MQTLQLPIESVQVVSGHRDRVFLHLSENAPGLEELHAGYDQWNDRTVEIATVTGNGEALARLLGWEGPVAVARIGSKC